MSSTLEYVSPRYLTAAETAKLVRQALKREFPGQKFSVRSSTYAGGASIDIGWTDGPTTKAVDQVVGVFAGADFDGMIDLKCYSQHWLEPDGTVHIAHAQGTQGSMGYLPEIIDDPRSPSAELVRFGADFVMTQRRESPEWRAAIFALFSEMIGETLDPEDWGVWRKRVPLRVDRLDGKLYRMATAADGDDLSSVFHQFTGWREGGSLDVAAQRREP